MHRDFEGQPIETIADGIAIRLMQEIDKVMRKEGITTFPEKHNEWGPTIRTLTLALVADHFAQRAVEDTSSDREVA